MKFSLPGAQFTLNCFCFTRYRIQWKFMSFHFERFCLYMPDTMPWAVLLSVWSSVGGCGWPMSSRVRGRGTACCAFINRPATSASAADDMTFFMILART